MVKINSKLKKKKKETKQQTASRRVSVESNSARREESKTVVPIKFSDYIVILINWSRNTSLKCFYLLVRYVESRAANPPLRNKGGSPTYVISTVSFVMRIEV